MAQSNVFALVRKTLEWLKLELDKKQAAIIAGYSSELTEGAMIKDGDTILGALAVLEKAVADAQATADDVVNAKLADYEAKEDAGEGDITADDSVIDAIKKLEEKADAAQEAADAAQESADDAEEHAQTLDEQINGKEVEGQDKVPGIVDQIAALEEKMGDDSVEDQITAALDELDTDIADNLVEAMTGLAEGEQVGIKISQTDGLLSGVTLYTTNIAKADELSALADIVGAPEEGDHEGTLAARLEAVQDDVDALKSGDESVEKKIEKALDALDYNVPAEGSDPAAVSDADGFVSVTLVQKDGKIESLAVATSDIAKASDLEATDGKVEALEGLVGEDDGEGDLFTRVAANEGAIEELQGADALSVKSVALTGDVTGTSTFSEGVATIATTVASVDAAAVKSVDGSKLDVSVIPAVALNTMVDISAADFADAEKVKALDVQVGDTVRVQGADYDKLYFVREVAEDGAKTLVEYTASADWASITNKPSKVVTLGSADGYVAATDVKFVAVPTAIAEGESTVIAASDTLDVVVAKLQAQMAAGAETATTLSASYVSSNEYTGVAHNIAAGDSFETAIQELDNECDQILAAFYDFADDNDIDIAPDADEPVAP